MGIAPDGCSLPARSFAPKNAHYRRIPFARLNFYNLKCSTDVKAACFQPPLRDYFTNVTAY